MASCIPIIQRLRNLHDADKDESAKAKTLELIETESAGKYGTNYARLWTSR